MRRINRAIGLVTLAGLCQMSPPGRADDPPVAPGRVDAFLEEWAKHASGLNSVDFRFTLVDHSAIWGDETRRGRAILAAPNLFYAEMRQEKPGEVETNRKWIVRKGNEIQDMDFGDQTQTTVKFRDDSLKSPGMFRLPFLFQTTSEDAKLI